jgi:hypothetical protein
MRAGSPRSPLPFCSRTRSGKTGSTAFQAVPSGILPDAIACAFPQRENVGSCQSATPLWRPTSILDGAFCPERSPGRVLVHSAVQMPSKAVSADTRSKVIHQSAEAGSLSPAPPPIVNNFAVGFLPSANNLSLPAHAGGGSASDAARSCFAHLTKIQRRAPARPQGFPPAMIRPLRFSSVQPSGSFTLNSRARGKGGMGTTDYTDDMDALSALLAKRACVGSNSL